MTDRCPQCGARLGPEDRFCSVCGMSRGWAPGGLAFATAPDGPEDDPEPGGERANDPEPGDDQVDDEPEPPPAAPTEAAPTPAADDDFVPLHIPPSARSGRGGLGGRLGPRALLIGLGGLLVLATLAAAVLAFGGNDNGGKATEPSVSVPGGILGAGTAVATTATPGHADATMAAAGTTVVALNNTTATPLAGPSPMTRDGGTAESSPGTGSAAVGSPTPVSTLAPEPATPPATSEPVTRRPERAGAALAAFVDALPATPAPTAAPPIPTREPTSAPSPEPQAQPAGDGTGGPPAPPGG